MRNPVALLFSIVAVAAQTVSEVKQAYTQGCCSKIGECYVTIGNTNYLGSVAKMMHQSEGNCGKLGDADSGITPCDDGLCTRDMPTYPHTMVFEHPTDSTKRSAPVTSDGVTFTTAIGPLVIADFVPVLGDNHKPYQYITVTNRASTLGQYIGLSSLTYDAVTVSPTAPTVCATGMLTGLKKFWIKYHVADNLMVPSPAQDGTTVPFLDAILALYSNYPYVALQKTADNLVLLTMKIEVTAC